MKKKETYTIDKIYRFDRDINYVPLGHLDIASEIKDLCRKNRIVVKSIKEIRSYMVTGTRTRSHKECEELQKALDQIGDSETILLRI